MQQFANGDADSCIRHSRDFTLFSYFPRPEDREDACNILQSAAPDFPFPQYFHSIEAVRGLACKVQCHGVKATLLISPIQMAAQMGEYNGFKSQCGTETISKESPL